MNTQALVAKWREEQETEKEDDPKFCCIPYGGERRISDCEKRRGENRVYYSAKRKDGLPTKLPKPKFVTCVTCNVWHSLPPQTIRKHPFQMRNRRKREGFTK